LSLEHTAVIGAGSWGTALANLLAKKGGETVLWSFEPEVAETIRAEQVNRRYLDSVRLDSRLRVTTDMEEALDGASVVLSCRRRTWCGR
jgi:glycerol-3-phosphate dehydrogenase (NAD(P)+)